MSIHKPLFAILALSALSAMTQTAFADDDRHECTPKITSTTISLLPAPASAPGWVISGHCLDEVTNVALARDDGMGYQDIPFTAVANSSFKTALLVPFVPRTGPIIAGLDVSPIVRGFGTSQYLLQIKRCKIKASGDKCTTFDEKFVFDGQYQL